MSRAALSALLLVACGSPAAPTLFPAGDKRDDGHGELAALSSSLVTGDENENEAESGTRTGEATAVTSAAPTGEYGGLGYGGVTYANYQVPPWPYPTANRSPTYTPMPNLTGAVEGTITWRGAVPRVITSCGAVEWLRVGAKRELGGALVYIQRVREGRPLVPAQSEQRISSVGGTIVKRGCALRPVAQIVTPVPARVAISGDRTPITLRLVTEGAPPRPVPLEEHGRVTLQAKAGVTRIDTVEGTVGAAWAIGVTSPAYAITDDAGRFRLDELAGGTYAITIFVPPPPRLQSGVIVYDEPIVVERTVTVGSATKPARLDVAVGR